MIRKKKMTAEQHQHFVNSLRQVLGLKPLYGQPKHTPWFIPFLGTGNRHNVRHGRTSG